MSKMTIGNGKIKMSGDFTGILIVKKSSNTDGFVLSGVTNSHVIGTGHHHPPRFRDKLKTILYIWRWL